MKKKTLILTSLTAVGLLTLAVVSGCNTNRAEESAPAVAPEQASEALAETVAVLVEREMTLRETEQEARVPVAVPAPAVEPAPEPEPEPEPIAVDLVSGTTLEIALQETLSSDINFVGDPVRATLAAPLVSSGVTVLESGAIVSGEVVEVVAPRKFGGKSMIAVRFDRIESSVGTSVPIESFLVAEGKAQKKKDTATIAGAAAGGAVLGRILGKDDKTESTAIGAVVGAAIGTAVAAKNATDPAILEAGAQATIVLESTVSVEALVEDGDVVAILTR